MSSQRVSIVDGPLAPMCEVRSFEDAGAAVTFEGIIRPLEGGRTISGLRYSAYEPMAELVLMELARDACARFEVTSIQVEHSRGFVATEQRSFRLVVLADHRRAALDATDWFINQMKRVVPIWKAPEYAADRDPSNDSSAERPDSMAEALP